MLRIYLEHSSNEQMGLIYKHLSLIMYKFTEYLQNTRYLQKKILVTLSHN